MNDPNRDMNTPTLNHIKALLRSWLKVQRGGELEVVLPEPGVDHDLVRRLLVEHKVEAALGPFLAADQQPPDFQVQMEQARHRTASLLMELERILPAVTWSRCRPVVLKGAALASSLYQDSGDRWFVDLDILVPRELMDDVGERLIRNGYKPLRGSYDPLFYERYHFHRIFVGPQGSCLEVHWDLVLPVSNFRFDLKGLYRRATTVNLGQLSLRVPAAVDQVLHGVCQNLADGFVDLRRVLDMALLMGELGEEDWLYLVKESRRTGTARGLYSSLHVVKGLAGLEPPPGVMADLDPGWWGRRVVKGLHLDASLVSRTAHAVEGHRYFLQVFLSQGLKGKWQRIRRSLFAGEAAMMLEGHVAGTQPSFWQRLRFFFYFSRQLLLMVPRLARAFSRA